MQDHKILSRDELLKEIDKILQEMSNEELAELYTRELCYGVIGAMTYLGDDLFEYEDA